METFESHEKNESVDKKPVDKKKINGEQINSKIERIQNEERISFNKEELQSLWKLDKDHPTAEILYETESWEKKDLSINVKKQTISIWEKKIKIDLPKWADLEEIDFLLNKIKISWSLWFFSWSWTAPYEKVLSALDDTLKNWYTKIASESWDIKFSKIA